MKIEDRPAPFVIALMVVAFVIFCARIASYSLPIAYRIIGVVISFVAMGFVGLSFVRSYETDRDGIIVTWYGVFKHKYSWSYFGEPYVCLTVNSNREFPCVVCAGKKFPQNAKHTRLMVIHPFSIFTFEYSPERIDKLTEHGVNVHYRASYADVIRSYEENLSRYRW